MERVAQDAGRLGLEIELRIMDQSTRTADDAAAACGCEVGQIVKSLVFEDASDGRLGIAARVRQPQRRSRLYFK